MNFLRRKRFEHDMDAELRFHIDTRVSDLMGSGLSRVEAVRRANVEFGSIEAEKDNCRQAAGLQLIDELRGDVRLAFRVIRQNPSFALVGILSLSLGIGANTAIFGVVDAVLLRVLPVGDPSRLVFVETSGTVGRDGPPYPFFEMLRERAKIFESVAAFSPSAMELTTDRGRELTRGVWVSGNFYKTLGVRPLFGRALTANDDQILGKGSPDGAVAVISRSYWQQRFLGDRTVLGRTVQLFNASVVIVGIMPDETMSLEPGRPVDVAAPMSLSDPALMRDRTSLWLQVIGRLKPEQDVKQARAEAETLFQAYMAETRVSDQIRKMLFQQIQLSPAGQGLSGLRVQFSKPLMALMILAGLVLLAACVNMTSLLLARATARQRDYAVRLAIGASRGRLIRQTMTDAFVLVAAGTAVGTVIAHWGQRGLTAFFAQGSAGIAFDLSLNTRVLLVTIIVSLVSCIALGLLPALRAAALDPANALQGGYRGVLGNRFSTRVGRGLVVFQIALSTMLLVGAGLFVRTLRALESIDLGFRRDGVLTMEVTPERELFGSAQWVNLQAEILSQVQHIPGVLRASWATMTPLSGRDRGVVVEVPGFSPKVETDKHIHLAGVSPYYFDTLGVPLLLGRHFRSGDRRGAPKVAILNESSAHFYFGRLNPLGHKIRFTNYPEHDLVYDVVGVIKDMKHDDLREPAARFIYVPIPQSPDRTNRLALVLGVSGERPIQFGELVRKQIQTVRSTLLVTNMSTMEKQMAQFLRRERLLAALSCIFGSIALILAAIGLYGTLAYEVTRRTGEIGIRMALGATRSCMVWLVLRDALKLGALGTVIGMPLAIVIGRTSKALLYGVTAVDPFTLAATAFLLIGIVVAAAIVPSRRVSRLDPSSALRSE